MNRSFCARIVGFASSIFLLTGCGETVSDGAPAGTPSDPTGITQPPGTTTPSTKPAQPSQLGVIGSFDVRFTKVTVTANAGQPQPGQLPEPASRTTPFRLDLKRDDSGKLLGAVTVDESATALALAGDVTANKMLSTFSGTSDSWKTFSLDRNADGSLKGTFTAKGEQTFGEGDVMYSYPIVGEGTFDLDKTKPESRALVLRSLAPKDSMLPWDKIEVQLAEPLDETATKTATHFEATGGSPLTMAWEPTAAHVTDWAGVSSITARATSWPPTASWSALVGAIADLAGLPGAQSSTPLNVLTLGSHASLIGFDDDILMANLWGSYALLGGGFSGANDSHCEAGGCLSLHTQSVNACGTSGTGMAARLQRGAANKVAVRYRVLVHPTYDNGGSSPPYAPSPATVQVAAEGGAVNESQISFTDAPLQKLGTAIDQYEWATAWSTLTIDAPTGTADLGVAVANLGTPYCGGPPFPEAEVLVLVEDVRSL